MLKTASFVCNVSSQKNPQLAAGSELTPRKQLSRIRQRLLSPLKVTVLRHLCNVRLLRKLADTEVRFATTVLLRGRYALRVTQGMSKILLPVVFLFV